MVANIQAISISIKPTRIIVSRAPIQSSVPAVAKEFSPDFCANALKVFLIKTPKVNYQYIHKKGYTRQELNILKLKYLKTCRWLWVTIAAFVRKF
jgi:hypothetical protein